MREKFTFLAGIFFIFRYFVGFFKEFITYNTNWHYLDIKTSIATKAGTTIELDVGIAYRYQIETIYKLFKEYPN